MNTIDEYRKRDYRVKCQWCGGWMKINPTTNTPLKRSTKNGNYCTNCEDLDHTPRFTIMRIK